MFEGLFVHMRLTWVSNGEAQEGEIVIELYPEEAPYHVNNFVALAEGGYYDDTIMHRIIQNFMICQVILRIEMVLRRRVWSGYCYGQPLGNFRRLQQTLWNLPDEADITYTRAICAFHGKNVSPYNSGGSQFFVVSPGVYPSHLDGVHTVFGKVISAICNRFAIEKVATSQYDRPILMPLRLKKHGYLEIHKQTTLQTPLPLLQRRKVFQASNYPWGYWLCVFPLFMCKENRNFKSLFNQKEVSQ